MREGARRRSGPEKRIAGRRSGSRAGEAVAQTERALQSASDGEPASPPPPFLPVVVYKVRGPALDPICGRLRARPSTRFVLA